MIDDDLIKPGALKTPELDFPPPRCPYCECDLELQETWCCPSCGATWDDHGRNGHRPCVQGCHRDSTLIGGDGQPRCAPCVDRIDAGQDEPVAPHTCTKCRKSVYGRTLDALLAKHGHLCAECASNASWDAWLAGRQAERVARAAATRADR